MEEQEEKITPEQMKQRRAEMLVFFEEQLPFLRVQKDYETHLTDIEELRTRRIRAQMMLAQMLAPAPEAPIQSPGPKDPGPVINTSPERKLKTN